MPETKQFREFIATKEPLADELNTAIAAISTDGIDRDKEVLLPKGVNFDNFNKNPVVLWAHDYSGTPVGRAQWIKQGRKYIKAKWEWATTEKAQEIRKLWDGGFLSAISVGFIISKSHEPTPADIKKTPEWAEVRRIIDEWELLEFSIVAVPANPEALAGIKALNISEATQKELGIEDETFIVYQAKKEIDSNNEETEIKLEPDQKPEETEDYIRVPVRSCDITATITISAKQGIKALYCGKVKKNATYLFAKAKDWTMAKAKAWVKEHDSGKSENEPVIVTPIRVLRPHRRVRRPRIIINPKDVASKAANMLRGRIYM